VAGDTYPREFLEKLVNLHQEVDAAVQPVASRLEADLVCARGCSGCCQDDLTVFTLEAALIRDRCPDVLAAGPAPVGACAFLDPDGACRIYPHRPYVCRTQGLPLRWLEPGPADGETERRDVCPLNAEVMETNGRPLAQLATGDCWTLGPWEGRLASLQAEADGRFEVRRTALRDLFY